MHNVCLHRAPFHSRFLPPETLFLWLFRSLAPPLSSLKPQIQCHLPVPSRGSPHRLVTFLSGRCHVCWLLKQASLLKQVLSSHLLISGLAPPLECKLWGDGSWLALGVHLRILSTRNRTWHLGGWWKIKNYRKSSATHTIQTELCGVTGDFFVSLYVNKMLGSPALNPADPISTSLVSPWVCLQSSVSRKSNRTTSLSCIPSFPLYHKHPIKKLYENKSIKVCIFFIFISTWYF